MSHILCLPVPGEKEVIDLYYLLPQIRVSVASIPSRFYVHYPDRSRGQYQSISSCSLLICLLALVRHACCSTCRHHLTHVSAASPYMKVGLCHYMSVTIILRRIPSHFSSLGQYYHNRRSKPFLIMSDTVPAVQYPARELAQEQRASASSSSAHHIATTAPPLPPRHSHHRDDKLDNKLSPTLTSGTGCPAIDNANESSDAGMTMSQSAGIGKGDLTHSHHQHGIHEFGHHHTDSHEHGHHSVTGSRGLDSSNASQHTHDALKK